MVRNFRQLKKLPEDLMRILETSPSVRWFSTIEELLAAAVPDQDQTHTVTYDIPGEGKVLEAMVYRAKNGIVANPIEPHMRRRDPDCKTIGDDLPTDKPRFAERWKRPFSEVREEAHKWLAGQELATMAFRIGPPGHSRTILAVCPRNAVFFLYALALLQGIQALSDLNEDFVPAGIIYVVPTFRHTHFDGHQSVVHVRGDLYEMYSFNFYPGPSAKKGVYGMLLHIGLMEDWITLHCSTVQVITPYGNALTALHEGASGGGKSENLQSPEREADGRLRFGENLETKEIRYVALPRACELRPVTDDMAMCHPSRQQGDGYLYVEDAEQGWFLRVDNIDRPYRNPDVERLIVNSDDPMLFMNIEPPANHQRRAYPWEHLEDEPGKPCPNPRVVIRRTVVPNVVTEPVRVDIRSFGVRTPPCSRQNPSFGILGLLHPQPRALAYLWRLVSPRGYANPSILSTDEGMPSEGVGSYWPFATGRIVEHANLLYKQIDAAHRLRYFLIPNQHIGIWRVGFMPQWLAREYLARRGHAIFRSEELTPARCSLVGYAFTRFELESVQIPHWFMRPETQPEVGEAAYDQGAAQLTEFFKKELAPFLEYDELLPEVRTLIDMVFDGASVEDYEAAWPVPR